MAVQQATKSSLESKAFRSLKNEPTESELKQLRDFYDEHFTDL